MLPHVHNARIYFSPSIFASRLIFYASQQTKNIILINQATQKIAEIQRSHVRRAKYFILFSQQFFLQNADYALVAYK